MGTRSTNKSGSYFIPLPQKGIGGFITENVIDKLDLEEEKADNDYPEDCLNPNDELESCWWTKAATAPIQSTASRDVSMSYSVLGTGKSKGKKKTY